MRQYGEAPDAPLNDRDKQLDRSPGNKSPSAKEVEELHRNSDVDGRPEAQHHTLGDGPNQAAAGDHDHRTKGVPIGTGLILTGDKAGANAAFLGSVANILKSLGVTDNSS